MMRTHQLTSNAAVSSNGPDWYLLRLGFALNIFSTLFLSGFFDGTELMVQLASAGALITGATFLVDMLAIWVFKQKETYRKLKFDDSDDHNVKFDDEGLLDVPAVLSGDEGHQHSESASLLSQPGGRHPTYGATNS